MVKSTFLIWKKEALQSQQNVLYRAVFSQGTGCPFIECIYLNSVHNGKHAASQTISLGYKTQTGSTKHLLGAPFTRKSHSNVVVSNRSQGASPGKLTCTECKVGLGTGKWRDLSQVTPKDIHRCEKTTKIICAVPLLLKMCASTAVSAALFSSNSPVNN